MEELLSILNKDLRYEYSEQLYGEKIIYVSLKKGEGICPYCGTKSTRTHSVYDKRLLKFGEGRKKTRIILMNKKMFCDNPECGHTTFAIRAISNDFNDKADKFIQAYLENA